MRRIPLRWCHTPALNPLIRAECNINIAPKKTGLRLKVILFESRRPMAEFFLRVLKKKMHRGVVGYCMGYQMPNGLADDRFFAIILLPLSVLTVEAIAHEAVHAAHRFAERVAIEWPGSDEENIAYPTGYIASAVSDWLVDMGVRRHFKDRKVRHTS